MCTCKCVTGWEHKLQNELSLCRVVLMEMSLSHSPVESRLNKLHHVSPVEVATVVLCMFHAA